MVGSIIIVSTFPASSDSPAESSCTGLDKKRNKLKKQLHKHAKSPKTVSDILAGVGGLESDMSFILQKLVIFSSIWAIVGISLLLSDNLLNSLGLRSELTFRVSRTTSN